MNLYLRLLGLIIRLVLRGPRPPAPFMDATELSFVAWPLDIDINLHLNNGRYLTLMDLGRIEYMHATGVLGPILRRGWRPVLGGARIEYKRPIPPFARFRLTTRLVFWSRRWFFLEQVFRIGDNTVAVGLVKALFVDSAGEVVDPSDLFEIVGVSPPSIEAPSAVQAWLIEQPERRKGVRPPAI